MGKKGKSTEEVTKKYEKSTTKYGKCTSKVRKSKQKVSEIQYVQFIENKYKKNQLTNLNLILQTNNIETQTKKSVLDFSTIIADVIFSVLMMATQDEVDRVCKEREVALGRVLQGWEREIIEAHLFNEQLKSATPEERISIDDYKKVISFRLGTLPSLTSPWKR